jgi:PPOX class probable F420-dependent enzyme
MAALALTPAVHEFLEPPRRYATLATVNRDGAPHQVVVWYLLRDDHLVINSRVGRRWPTNALRDPRVSLTITDRDEYITLNGELEPIHDPVRGQKDIAEMAHRYLDDEAAAANIRVFETHERVSFIFRPTSAHADTE